MKRIPALVVLLSALPALATATIRVGLDTQAMEYIVSLEGGGEVRSLQGKVLLKLKDGEKLRIWWDGRGEADPTDEFRVQVGAPLTEAGAETLMQRLRTLGEAPERVHVPDGNSWRVLTGHFASAREAEPILEKLGALGYEELWVATERLKAAPHRGRALYAVTERYERLALPNAGVELRANGELTTLAGKGRYRGRMTLFPNAQGRLTVVNSLDLETYLRGVVPREMGAWEFPAIEALKAQAVAARTYAYKNRNKRAKDGFDLLDTVADQVYGGRDGEQALTDRAIRETTGLIATYGGQPIQALFMANGGGATVDNTFVFGDGHPYLKGVSSYAAVPETLGFTGICASQPDSPITWELLRLAAAGLIPAEWLEADQLSQPLRAADLRPVLEGLTRRLGMARPEPPTETGAQLCLWLARGLGFQDLVEGMERPQDYNYMLGEVALRAQDRALASFLTRRGLVAPALWRNPQPTLAQTLQVLGRLWQELEAPDWLEGTLLRDGQVRVKNAGPGPLPLAPRLLLAEEAPGGSLRLVTASRIQVGDRVKWTPVPGGSPVLVRRLDPDGASLDRYNPTAHWKVELKEADLLGRLRERAGIASLSAIELSHNDQGRVLTMTVRDGKRKAHLFTGMRIRNLLGLKDNVFRMVAVGRGSERRWIIYGRGWGHGVGMDQTGAYGMALEGASFEGILKHYYHGIQLTPISD
jgi:stage II sporulation protein D